MKKTILIVAGISLLFSSCAREGEAQATVSEAPEAHAIVYQFNYEDARNLAPGEFIQFNKTGGVIARVNGGFIVSLPSREGTVFVPKDEFQGKGE